MSIQNRRQVSSKTHKMLWGRAASLCAFPECRRELVMDGNTVDGASLVGQECHIVAKEPDGPRGDSLLTSKQRDEYDNLILLCNIHHKLIDDQPNTYTVEYLRAIKAAHEQWVRESLQGTAPLWTVPYQRNPFFTGREDLLDLLHDRLSLTKATALTQSQAISGLGGIGKTQIAVEYAYTYRDAYQAVLWVRAMNHETLTLDYVTIANLLHLSKREESEQHLVVEDVKHWLATHTHWLLILDNADDLTIVSEFLPTVHQGHIVLTTRSHTTGRIAQRVEVDTMKRDEAVLLLLRSAKILTAEEPLTQAIKARYKEANALVQELGGLPLALDQAGAYIEETEGSMSKYLSLYQTHRKELLQLRGKLEIDYPESVATTWSLSFQHIEKANRAAADVLRLCAFLDPDAIPEELLIQDIFPKETAISKLVGNEFLLEQAIKELLRFSLVQRDTEKRQVSFHRLVQAVIKDEMEKHIYLQWAENTIRAVNKAFPDVEVETWEQCRPYLSHAQACVSLIEQEHFTFSDALEILTKVATYYRDHALYLQAILLWQYISTLREQILGPLHPSTATSLNNLAFLYEKLGNYELAGPLFQRALAIRMQVLGPLHPDTAGSLNNLGFFYERQAEYELAKQYYEQALAIRMQVLGPLHPNTATTLNNLATVNVKQGNYEVAELYYQRALAIREQILGPQHPSTTESFNNLAFLYNQQGKYNLAEPLLQRALTINEQILGPQHPNIASILNNLAALHIDQKKYELAEPLLQRALAICEQTLGPQHPITALTLNSLALLYDQQGKYELAEPLFQRALAICEQTLGPQHPDTTSVLNNLALLYDQQGKYELAEPLFKRILAIHEQVLEPPYSSILTTLNNLTLLYKKQDKYKQTEPIYQQIIAINEQVLGPQHIKTAQSLLNLVYSYVVQGKYELAEPLLQRSSAIYEQVLGPQHPETKTMRENYNTLLKKIGKNNNEY